MTKETSGDKLHVLREALVTLHCACAARGQVIALGLEIYIILYCMSAKKFQNFLNLS